MPLLKLRTHGPAGVLTALEMQVLELTVTGSGSRIGLAPLDFPADNVCRADARRALSALWRRGLLTRVGWGDTAVYRRKP